MSKNYAVIDENNTVINIIVANDDFVADDNFIEYLDSNAAYIGGDYIEGKFYSHQPFPSWSRDGNGNWVAPVPMPTDGAFYWNEETQQWQPLLG